MTDSTPKAKITKTELRRKLNPSGNTVIKDFGRVIRNEPHKYIYAHKLYPVDSHLPMGGVMEWLRERYIEADGHIHHGKRYEVQQYTGQDGKRYVHYILLETFTEDEEAIFTLTYGQLSRDPIRRDGKRRRPKLKPDQRKELDRMINDYYIRIALEKYQ